MRDAAGELRMLGQPPLTERCLALQIGDAAFGYDDPAVESVGHGLRVRAPVLLSTQLG